MSALPPKADIAEPATLKVSPAMAAGVTDRLWEMAYVVEMGALTMAATTLSIITCPLCSYAREEQMPPNACQFFYDCKQ